MRNACIGVAVFVLALCCGALRPVFLAARPATARASCLSNVRQIAIGFQVYAADNDERLTASVEWLDRIEALGTNEAYFHCPGLDDKQHDYGYAMNVAASHINVAKVSGPEAFPIVFESVILARNACSGFDGFPNPSRHGGRDNVAFLDGHAKSYSPDHMPSAGAAISADRTPKTPKSSGKP